MGIGANTKSGMEGHSGARVETDMETCVEENSSSSLERDPSTRLEENLEACVGKLWLRSKES